MRYQVNFLLPLKLQKISYYFGLCQKILLANQFAGFFTFDFFDLLILIPGVHCYILLVISLFLVYNLGQIYLPKKKQHQAKFDKTKELFYFFCLCFEHYWQNLLSAEETGCQPVLPLNSRLLLLFPQEVFQGHCLKLFGNSYTKIIVIEIKFHFTCVESNRTYDTRTQNIRTKNITTQNTRTQNTRTLEHRTLELRTIEHQNIEQQNMEHQNKEHQDIEQWNIEHWDREHENIKHQNIEYQNTRTLEHRILEHQNIRTQNITIQNTRIQNIRTQNIRIQNNRTLDHGILEHKTLEHRTL